MSPNAYNLKALKRLGIDIPKLGCVMLELEQLPVKNHLPEEWGYFNEEKYYWIRGLEIKSHVTLKFGLIEKAFIWKEHVDEVLEGWELKPLTLTGVIAFDSNLEGEDYACIVGQVESGGSLEEASQRLSMLPHIDTFPFKAHVTLGYVRGEHRQDALDLLSPIPQDMLQLKPKGISYGKEKL